MELKWVEVSGFGIPALEKKTVFLWEFGALSQEKYVFFLCLGCTVNHINSWVLKLVAEMMQEASVSTTCTCLHFCTACMESCYKPANLFCTFYPNSSTSWGVLLHLCLANVAALFSFLNRDPHAVSSVFCLRKCLWSSLTLSFAKPPHRCKWVRKKGF